MGTEGPRSSCLNHASSKRQSSAFCAVGKTGVSVEEGCVCELLLRDALRFLFFLCHTRLFEEANNKCDQILHQPTIYNNEISHQQSLFSTLFVKKVWKYLF